MLTVIFGILFIGFTFYACVPGGLGWSEEVIHFLKGGSPVLSALVGIVMLFVGFADMKDRREAKLEEEEARRAEEASKK